MARTWTINETNYLQDNWGHKSVNLIARDLKRSSSAILNKVARLNLGSFIENGDYITLNTFLNYLRGDLLFILTEITNLL